MKLKNNVIVEFDDQELKHLVIPKEAKAIDPEADFVGFYGQLENVEVEEGNSVFYVKNNCLLDKDGVLYYAAKGATIPDDGSVKVIKSFAFNMVESVNKTVRIPESVEILGTRVFNGSNIEKLYIPASVRSMAEGVFLQDCDKNSEIIVDENNPCYYARGGCLVERESQTLIAVFGDEITIPDGVKRIGAGVICFHDFKKIIFPSSINDIDKLNFLMICNPIVLVHKNSYAEKIVKENKLNYSYIE